MGGTIASIFASVFPKYGAKLFLIEGLGPLTKMKSNPSKDFVVTFINAHIKVTIKYIRHSLIFANASKRFIHIYLMNKHEISHGTSVIEVKSGEWTWRYDVRHKDAAAVSFHSGRHMEVLYQT